uniref:Uncharacterized protein n=1 Tax=Cacopsylla melanoneura TaxID=428564 RepID=A0A8D8TGQ3_9HEMI
MYYFVLCNLREGENTTNATYTLFHNNNKKTTTKNQIIFYYFTFLVRVVSQSRGVPWSKVTALILGTGTFGSSRSRFFHYSISGILLKTFAVTVSFINLFFSEKNK